MNPLEYLVERRKIVFRDEWLYYGAMATLYYTKAPKKLLYTAGIIGATFVLRGYNHLSKLEQKIERFDQCEERRYK